jgi:hypothetical protein
LKQQPIILLILKCFVQYPISLTEQQQEQEAPNIPDNNRSIYVLSKTKKEYLCHLP